MTAIPSAALARRYFLGSATEDECAALEEQCVVHQDASDLMAEVEETLIEEYLADELSPAERDAFERMYLANSAHRIRVETIRRLSRSRGAASAAGRGAAPVVTFPRSSAAHNGPSADPRPSPRLASSAPGSTGLLRGLAIAASLVLAAASLWFFWSRDAAPTERAEQVTPPATQPETPVIDRGAPVVFTFALSTMAIRGASEAPALVIPAGTDQVRLQLELDTTRPAPAFTKAVVRTVGGTEVWQGTPVAAGTASTTMATIDVPAAQLSTDDYLVVLYSRGSAGLEQEWAQYFLRVR